MTRVQEQHRDAKRVLASGVSSSTRVNQALGHAMLFERASGCRAWDLDGREYIDLCTSHGATLLGHGDVRVRAAVERSLSRGAPCAYEAEEHAELADLLCQSVPCVDLVRFTGSGTEATMHCLRLARAFTGRQKLLRFEGNFHGYHDQVMWTAKGSLGEYDPELKPISTGITRGMDEHLLQIPYNDIEKLQRAFDEHGSELAAAICEPVFFNAGCILPTREWIQALRDLCTRHGALLVFDEILCAFRMGVGGAQEFLNVTPDLCTLGKAIGGGLPLSVFGGREEIMRRLMPEGDCQHSGTYNGHPLVIAAGLAAVKAYREPDFYDHIAAIHETLVGGLRSAFAKHRINARVQALGARFGVYFGVSPDSVVSNYAEAMQHDRATLMRFYALAIKHGVYFHDYNGAPCHHGFCAAMSQNDVDIALSRLDLAIAELAA